MHHRHIMFKRISIIFFIVSFVLSLLAEPVITSAQPASSNYVTRKGIDISHWQEDINWEELKATGIEFVIIKFGGRLNSGKLYIDSKFHEYIEAAQNAGLKVGIYFWSEATTEEEAIEEVDFIVSNIYRYSISLPICMDYEWCPEEYIDSCRIYNSGQTLQERTSVINTFIARCRQYQYAGMLYANRNMLRNYVDPDSILEYGRIWLASYSNPQWTYFGDASTDYTGIFDIMQFTSCGKIAGISGNVDFDYWYDDGTISKTDYSDIFDPEYYAARYPDLVAVLGTSTSALLQHFIDYGMSEGRQGSATFSPRSYIYRYPDLRAAFGNNIKQYYLHYISYGRMEGRVATGCDKMIGATTIYNGIDYSDVYDYTYYSNHYSDVFKQFKYNDKDTLAYFVNIGMKNGMQGIESFDPVSYMYQYKDLRNAFGSHLTDYYTHYMECGKREGRSATGQLQMRNYETVHNGIDYSAVYDFNYYVNRYPDLNRLFRYDEYGALQHFVTYGMSEGRQAIETFSVKSYRNQYQDLRQAFGSSLIAYYRHYISYGKNEGRAGTGCNSLQNALTTLNGNNYQDVYDYNYYVSHNPDVVAALGTSESAILDHFVTYGMSEGRRGCETFSVRIYKNNYPDLQAAFGDNLKQYYLHYINYGKSENRKAQ